MVSEDDCCPLCMEDLDVTDRNFRPCRCGYQICLFCYRHIKDDLNGLCPACRTPYNEANVSFVTADPQEMARLSREKKAREIKERKEQQAKEAKEKREAELKTRQEALARASAAAVSCSASAPPRAPSTASLNGSAVAPAARLAAGAGAVSQLASCTRQPANESVRESSSSRSTASKRTVVQVMGLSPRIAKEEILRRPAAFGQSGTILHIEICPAATPPRSGPLSVRCAITYAAREEAEQAVLAVDNVVLDGRTLKASCASGASAAGGESVDEREAGKEGLMSRGSGGNGGDGGDDGACASAVRAVVEAAVAPHAIATVGGNQNQGANERALHGWDSAPGMARPVSAVGPAAMSAGASQPTLDAPVFSPVFSEGGSQPTLDAPDGHGGGGGGGGGGVNSAASVTLGSAGQPASMSLGAGPTNGAAHGGANLGVLGGQPTGADYEPWSLMGSFEDLLNGLVGDEPEGEETTSLSGTSRFARFFSSQGLEDGAGHPDLVAARHAAADGSTVASLGGLALEDPFCKHGAAKQNDDWQEDFRALLPNVNISFTPFGSTAALPCGGSVGSDGATCSERATNPVSEQGLAALSGCNFGGPAVGVDPTGACGSAFGAAGGCLGSTLTTAGLSGTTGLPGLCACAPLSASADGSFLQQLTGNASASVPGAPLQLPGSQLSSQLQRLLQGDGGTPAASLGICRAPGGAAVAGAALGGAPLGSALVGGTPVGSGAVGGGVVGGGTVGGGVVGGGVVGGGVVGGGWSSARGGELAGPEALPGWLHADKVLSVRGGVGGVAEDGVASEGGSAQKESNGTSSTRGGKKEGAAGDRTGKNKKRGGTNNRSKGEQTKLVHIK